MDIATEILKYFKRNIDQVQYSRLLKYAKMDANGSSSVGDNHNIVADLLRVFISYDNRHISLISRKVYISDKLKNQLLNEYKNYELVVQQIVNRLRDGQDVNDRLSTKLSDVLYEDGMLNDWRMYHFHLGKRRVDNYCERTGTLLIGFIPLQDHDIYLLEIIPHHIDNAVFANKEYIEIIHQNWPNVIKYVRIHGMPMGPELTMQQRFNLRKNGVNTADIIDGEAYFGPGLGVTSAGTSVAVQLKVNMIYNWVGINTIRLRQVLSAFTPSQIPEWLDYKLKLDDKMRRFIIQTNRGEKVMWHKY